MKKLAVLMLVPLSYAIYADEGHRSHGKDHINSVFVDFNQGEIYIHGNDLIKRNRIPKVMLGETELFVCQTCYSDSLISASIPSGLGDGDYKLSLIRKKNDTIRYDLTVGAVGPEGQPGVQGEVGPMGGTGPQGPIGLQGATGDDGDDGAQGSKGETGDMGPSGATGMTGPQGVAGAGGMTGPQGLSGINGILNVRHQWSGNTFPMGPGDIYGYQVVHAACNATEKVIGGGHYFNVDDFQYFHDLSAHIVRSHSENNGWEVSATFKNNSNGSFIVTLSAEAICAEIP